MWKYVVTSVRGSAHLVNGLPCQDSGLGRQIGEVIVIALADGAGSAKFSDEGSRVVVETTLEFFANFFAGHPQPGLLLEELDITDGRLLLKLIRQKLENFANDRSSALHEYASTMLVGIIHHSGSCFYQIGDGVWCVSKSNVLAAATWPQQGEYAGQTDFVTSKIAEASLQFAFIKGSIDFAVGMTDGLERLALDFRCCVPHRGFCEPLINGLLEAKDQSALKHQLDLFLESSRILERTDDDKTLALIAHDGL